MSINMFIKVINYDLLDKSHSQFIFFWVVTPSIQNVLGLQIVTIKLLYHQFIHSFSLRYVNYYTCPLQHS